MNLDRRTAAGRARRRGPAVGHHRARDQARPGVAAAGLAHRGAVRPGRRRAPGRRPLPGRRRLPPGRARLGRGRVRRVDPGPERRDHPHQREPCRPAHRGHTRAGGDHRRPAAPQRGPSGGLDGLCRVARRRRAGRRRRGRRRDPGRRRAGPGLAGLLGLVHRGPGPAAARPRPGRRDRRAVPRGGARHPPRGRRHRGGPAGRRRRGRRGWPPPGWCCWARSRRPRCSPSARPGSRPRSPARSSTWSRSSARPPVPPSSATRSAWPRPPGPRPS